MFSFSLLHGANTDVVKPLMSLKHTTVCLGLKFIEQILKNIYTLGTLIKRVSQLPVEKNDQVNILIYYSQANHT